MKATQNFMMVFRFTPNFEYQPTEIEMAQMKEQWGNFIGNIAIKEKLVSTYQLGFEGKQISADLSVSEGILISENKTLGGNMVVKANSLEEAITMAKDCPILKMGGTVEVRTITPMEN
ncbi:MAG: YciI family protein [Maribacter sp.]